jgi:hypothetical protein
MKFDMLRFLTHLVVRPYKAKRPPSKTVAIVVPMSARAELLPEEEVSIRHLRHFLGGYDKYLVTPPGIFTPREGFKMLRFHRKFFGSAAAHNRLLMWPGFYRTFLDYEYILIYHLDSLVLSDEITPWCRVGLDYIGAPWLPCPDTPWVKEVQVGNGGFTLMKVESVLKVLHNRYRKEPATYWSDILTRNRTRLRLLFRLLEWLAPRFPRSRIINRPLEDWRITEKPEIHGRNNDFFWSFDAARYLPEFKVGAVEEGLRFAFEAAPRMCFELNQHKLPFGCHAWAKFDPDFWAPHLLTADGSKDRYK